MTAKIFRLLLVLWAGSLWSTLWAASTLFRIQSDRHLAGVIAARFFAIETYLGLGVGVLALLLPIRRRFLWGFLAVLLLSVNDWMLKPVMMLAHARGAVAGLGFGAWHGVSALVYGAAALSVAVLVWKEEFI